MYLAVKVFCGSLLLFDSACIDSAMYWKHQ